MRIWLGLIGGALMATLAEAGTCGGPVPCQCGDTVSGTAVLTDNLFCSSVPACHGGTACAIYLPSGAHLDCGGHWIIGVDPKPAGGCTTDPANTPGCLTGRYGIYSESTRGVMVNNCGLAQFERGIYLNRAQAAQVRNIMSAQNTRYGGQDESAPLTSPANSWYQSAFVDNGDEGMHIGHSWRVSVYDSEAARNQAEGFYVLSSSSVRLSGINAHDNGVHGEAGVYIKESSSTTVSGTVTNDPLTVIGHAVSTHLSGLVLTNSRIRLDSNGTGSPVSTTCQNVCLNHQLMNATCTGSVGSC